METLLYLPEKEVIKDFVNFICDYATIVITSREILDMDCEEVYELRRFTTEEAFRLFVRELTGITPDASEQRLIRVQIVEGLLDNNPLAIKLVAKNIPKGKRFSDLQRELESDIFRKASDSEMAEFDRVSDGNIERKKSLYASINFSYRHLSGDEKKVFEILSLFPDGIDLVNLKRIADSRRVEQRSGKKSPNILGSIPIITDVVIKSLEKKSMTQVDNNNIKLQSIVGKFAEHQLLNRNQKELLSYYQNAAHYLGKLADYLANLTMMQDKAYFASKVFNEYQGNFIKSVKYIGSANLPPTQFIEYLMDLNLLASGISLSNALARAMSKNSGYFKDDAAAQLCFDTILLSARYYGGDFKESFDELKRRIPLSQLVEFIPENTIDEMMISQAMSIYGMEGEQLSYLALCMKIKWNTNNSYPSQLSQIGEFDLELLGLCSVNFFSLEIKLAVGQLTINAVNVYCDTIYEKDHLNLIQCEYLKVKLGVIDRARIKKLTTINPFTTGLQKIMLASAEANLENKVALFEGALGDLHHIKYYYVEALLLYSRCLQQGGASSTLRRNLSTRLRLGMPSSLPVFALPV